MPAQQKKTSRAPQAPARLRPKRSHGRYVLRLFVAGATDRSRLAVLRVRKLRAEQLTGACELEVIDIYQQPKLARTHQIVATPTLVIEFPPPLRRFIGSLTNLNGFFVKVEALPKEKLTV